MFYQSTRGGGQMLTSAEAIVKGLSDDGGLYAPVSFPMLAETDIAGLAPKPYKDRAAHIIGLFLDDFSAEELERYASGAYSAAGFDHPSIAPLHMLDSNTYFLELWHGPTCAFKDMALQMLPRLLPASLQKTGESRDACILVATSGDTGKAALEGFSGVPGTKIMVFYPKDGVSEVQELQMTSQDGANVNVTAVEGNFDVTQTGVKTIFSDDMMRRELSGRGYFLSSANSINWGRLVPQIAYYFSAYCDLIAAGGIKPGDRINFCVPTGNFGNILAAYYAEKIGLPVNKLICASNRNDVLAQFISTGVYDMNRPFHTTISPSMDILISSNLERLLFELSGKDGNAVAGYMSALSGSGRYEITPAVRDEVGRIFGGGVCSEDDTMETLADMFDKHGYLIDTHTAVGYKVLEDYRAGSGDRTVSVVVSTASPFKFCDSVIGALSRRRTFSGMAEPGVLAAASGALRRADAGDDAEGPGAMRLVDLLSEITGRKVPAPLAGLRNKRPRFTGSVMPDCMKTAVLEFLS